MSWHDRLRIVLIEPRNPLNIGAAARAMFNFGFSELWLVDPYHKAFREARSAVGAAEVLERARVTSDRAEALGGASLIAGTSTLHGRADDMVQRELSSGALAVRTHLDDRRAALVFGSEKFGLSREDLSFCDWVTNIPTRDRCPSMNLGQAVAVCCYEIAQRARVVPELSTPASAGAEERDRILGLLMPLLEQSGFVHESGRATQQLKLRRFVSRLRLAPDDARLMQGMLRQIQWKLGHPGTREP